MSKTVSPLLRQKMLATVHLLEHHNGPLSRTW
jgi:hypothetical protein